LGDRKAYGIGADTVLKLGAQTPAQSAGKILLNMPPIPGTQWGIPQWKTNIVKITQVKNKALLTWRLADIHGVSQNTPPEI